MTNKKHSYDWDAMEFVPDEDDVDFAFVWEQTPQGHYWWVENRHNPEGQAEFARMKRLYVEDVASMGSMNWFRIIRPLRPIDEKKGPVRTVTKKKIVPGVYGRIEVDKVTGQYVHIAIGGDSMLDAAELTDAIETLTQIRDALDA